MSGGSEEFETLALCIVHGVFHSSWMYAAFDPIRTSFHHGREIIKPSNLTPRAS
jgi:hypothetical protein